MKNLNTPVQDLILPAQDDLFQLMLNNISESFVLLDTNLVILQSNKAARYGIWSKVGMHLFPGFNILDSIDDDRIPLLQATFADVLKGHERKTEYAYLLPEGTRYFENNVLPARNNDGEIIGIIIYSKDIT